MSLAAELAAQHGALIRLGVLQLLGEIPNHRAIEQLLHPPLEAMDLICSLDQLRAHLIWLEEQGLVEVETNRSGGLTVTLLERGADVARGAAKHPGVAPQKLKR